MLKACHTAEWHFREEKNNLQLRCTHFPLLHKMYLKIHFNIFYYSAIFSGGTICKPSTVSIYVARIVRGVE